MTDFDKTTPAPRFLRAQPEELRRLPFAEDGVEVPALGAALAWALVAVLVVVLANLF